LRGSVGFREPFGDGGTRFWFETEYGFGGGRRVDR
jgi:hypothetical protein